MADAANYEEWTEAALEHDQASGAARWKLMDQSSRFDFVSIRTRLDHLRHLRAQHDDRGLLFALNEGIHGNMGGMGTGLLYAKAKFGTKRVIADYVEEIALALEHLASSKVDTVSFEEKLDFFHRANHCFGRSALMLSGSGSLVYFHVGVVKALHERGLLPDIISGSSGGALVGSVACASTDEELNEWFDPSRHLGKARPETLLGALLSHVRPQRMRTEDVWEILERFLPDYTFQEAFERTGRHMNVSVAPAESLQKHRLLNADTSPNVFMREAVLASAAFPGFFDPVVLMARDDKGERQAYHGSRKWVDGSLRDDLPAKRLARLYGVNHYIVSQANPYIIPFIDEKKTEMGTYGLLKRGLISSARTWVNTGVAVMEGPLSKMPEIKRMSNTLLAVINQTYVGDINITPSQKLHNPLKSLAWRTYDEIAELVEQGERATWPQLERIRIQTRISRVLDSILRRYEDLHIELHNKPRQKRKSTPASRRVKAT